LLSGDPSTFPVSEPSRFGSDEPGRAPSVEGSCWPCDNFSIGYVSDLVKANTTGWNAKFADDGDETTLSKALSPGERWITVHPNGEGTKGVPILITEHPDGTASVIGGAGGKLNYLKLRGIKPQSSYREHAAESRKARQLVKKQQRQRDKELGLAKDKQAARDNVTAQQREHEKNYIKTVSEAMGWKPEDTEFDATKYADLSEPAQRKLKERFHAALLKKADEAVEMNRQRLLADKDAADEIGDIPLESKNDDQLSVSDIEPVKSDSSKGFAAHFQERAEAHGATEEEIHSEANEARQVKQATMTDAQREAAIRRGQTAQQVRTELEAIKEPVNPEAKARLVEAKTAVDLLKEQKKLKAIRQKAREARRD
jgi:hypothetical protein